MAITSTFSSGALSVIGDSLDNNVSVGRNVAGEILVNGGAVATVGGTPTVANTSRVQAFGLAGNDVITVNETNGALPDANLFGGAGNDVLTGGSGADQLFGEAGNDTLLGKGGNDLLFGGADNDTLTGGDGDDQMFGQGGNDRMIWNPGDDSDLMEGGEGTDTAEVNGGNGAEQFTLTANGTRVRFDRVNPAPFSLDIGTTEKLVLNMNGGDDSFSATGNLAALISVTVDGGAGNDTILGSNGADVLLGGDGNDFIDGQQGNDTVLLGAGDDVFQWDPGDGSDVVEGQGGNDTMIFNGANVGEIFTVSANGNRASFTRNVANIAMDLNDVERIDLRALGGVDVLVVNDLTATDVDLVNVDLAESVDAADTVRLQQRGGDSIGFSSSGTSLVADGLGTQVVVANAGALDQVVANGVAGATDTVNIRGAAAADAIHVSANGASVNVSGLAVQVAMQNTEATDRLVINGNAGDDTIDAVGNLAPLVRLTIDGGAGNDRILGGNGADVLLGGDGNDFIDGQQGNDTALLGAGDDVFQWDPGDGSDVIEGQAGRDTLLFNGSNIGEIFNVSANGNRVSFTRNIANIAMDLNDMERIDVRALGGIDEINISDLSATDVREIAIDLAGTAGTADGALDEITVAGRASADNVTIGTVGAETTITGLPATLRITNADAASDALLINTGAGNDVVNASAMLATGVALTVDAGAGNDRIQGGAGADVIFGGAGNDTIDGNRGNDTAFMGDGDDRFVWDAGDGSDTIDGQAGFDTHEFNGSNANENFVLAAGGNDVILTRNVGNIVMNQDNVERVELSSLGGTDNIEIGELRGTDVREVLVDLGGVADGTTGDGARDTVIVNGGAQSEILTVTASGDDIAVNGLANLMRIANTDFQDDVIVRGAGGTDVISALSVPAAAAHLTLDGGAGNDTLIAGARGTTLLGGAGDDLLIGNSGNDILNAGAGRDILVGGGGNDLFAGDDDFTILDFSAGAGSGDRIDLRNVAGLDDFGDVIASARAVIGGTVLDFGDDQITLLGVNAAQLNGDDFLI